MFQLDQEILFYGYYHLFDHEKNFSRFVFIFCAGHFFLLLMRNHNFQAGWPLLIHLKRERKQVYMLMYNGEAPMNYNTHKLYCYDPD